jgi:hypothetical protein
LKEFAFRTVIRRLKTISTWNLVRKQSAAWSDPVHLEARPYGTIVAAVAAAATKIGSKRPGGELTTASPRKKKRGNGGSIANIPPRGGVQPRRGRGVRGWNKQQRSPLT